MQKNLLILCWWMKIQRIVQWLLRILVSLVLFSLEIQLNFSFFFYRNSISLQSQSLPCNDSCGKCQKSQRSKNDVRFIHERFRKGLQVRSNSNQNECFLLMVFHFFRLLDTTRSFVRIFCKLFDEYSMTYLAEIPLLRHFQSVLENLVTFQTFFSDNFLL